MIDSALLERLELAASASYSLALVALLSARLELFLGFLLLSWAWGQEIEERIEL